MKWDDSSNLMARESWNSTRQGKKLSLQDTALTHTHGQKMNHARVVCPWEEEDMYERESTFGDKKEEGKRKEGGRSKKLNTLYSYSQKRALKAPSFFFSPHFFFGVSRRGAALK